MSPARRKLRIAPGGVAHELGKEATRSGPRPLTPNEPQPAPPTAERPPVDDPDDDDRQGNWLKRRMAPRRLPGARVSGRRIRWSHVVKGSPCHAFTTPRKVYDDWMNGEPLSARGAVYPDGKPVVPEGTDPASVYIRCGTCGSHSVELLQLVFFLE